MSVPNPRRALLVEDEPEFQNLLRLACRKLAGDWLLHCCRTGKEALAAIDAGDAFDIALVDIGLPDISGLKVIDALRDRSADTPILVVSVLSDQRNVLAAIRAGACGYVLKDDSQISIARAIDQVLQGIYPLSPSLARYLFSLAGKPLGATKSPLPELSPRELKLLNHIAGGLSYAQAAVAMNISLSTVQTHIRHLYRKLDVHSQTQAVAVARAHGLVEG